MSPKAMKHPNGREIFDCWRSRPGSSKGVKIIDDFLYGAVRTSDEDSCSEQSNRQEPEEKQVSGGRQAG